MILQPNQLDTIDTPKRPTIWGLTLSELHSRIWAAHGVQVVTPCDHTPLARHAEIYLLTSEPLMVLFPLRELLPVLIWLNPKLLWLRIRDRKGHDYRERVVTDAHNRFLRIRREYTSAEVRLDRVALTTDHDIARIWQESPDAQTGWQRLRAFVPRNRRIVRAVSGRTCDLRIDEQAAQFIHDLVPLWKQPDVTVSRIRHERGGVWADMDSDIARNATFIGPAWIGVGRTVEAKATILGPAVFWDAAPASPAPLQWDTLEPVNVLQAAPIRQHNTLFRRAKRIFDVLFALFAIALTLPIYPLVMFAIWLEDGRPFFFAHQRETKHGKLFPCLKFRSMRRDADRIKAELMTRNQVDGPQFKMDDDPRITYVGKWIRKCHIDEWPQFINVLLGHMSVVGPRPSPFSENQYCPAWRESRLSILPGITGLWQVSRTRGEGLDFQEWIKYDLEYVRRQSLLLDISIILRTILLLVKEIRK